MNRIVVVVACVAFLLVSAPGFAKGTEPGPTDYVIKVTSAVPGKEVAFRGAIAIKAEGSPLQIVTERTPFEVKSKGTLASGMFRVVDDGARIQVEFIANQERGKKARTTCTGPAVLIGDSLAGETWTFTTIF